jgi:hypothetical protein
MKRRTGWLPVLAVTVGLAGAAVPQLRRWWVSPPPGYCPICRRHEHPDSVVKLRVQGVGVIDVCCLSCALSYERQNFKPVTIVSVTDHQTGGPLAPDTATFVVGSDVSPCTHSTEPLRMEGQALSVQWDRCLPSILAFSSLESAAAFRRQHGGRVRTLPEIKQELTPSARAG